MNWKKLGKYAFIYLGFCVFAFVCAVGIAELEIIEEYRPLVYLGTALALPAAAFAAVFVFFFGLGRLNKKISKFISMPDATKRLGALLGRHKNKSAAFLISQNIAYCHIKNGEYEKARGMLELLSPGYALYFNMNNQRELLGALAVIGNDGEGFKRLGCTEPQLKRWSFLDEALLERWKSWCID